jgi:hypothetical protein
VKHVQELEATVTSERQLLSWAEIPEATLRKWKKCYGTVYEHNSWIPRVNWLTDASVKISGMTHVRTSPFYPQSNGEIERYHRTVKSRCIRPASPRILK